MTPLRVPIGQYIPPWGSGADTVKLTEAITAPNEDYTPALVSNCCGAAPKFYGDYDSDSTDWGYCPECGDHCEFVPEEE